MIGTGTLINVAAIIAGGLVGKVIGGFFNEKQQETLSKACGVSVLFIALAGAMEGMLSISGEAGSATLAAGRSMFVVVSLCIGAVIGELINIEGGFEKFGAWLKVKSGNSKERMFIDAFVTASITVCTGAMIVVGALKDGISGDPSILILKSVLDFIIIVVMTSSMGKGCAFSAVPVLVLEGGLTLFAKLISPVLTQGAITNISLIGSVLIFCVGVNLVWGKQMRVANMLPAIVVAVIIDYLPFTV